MHIVFYWDFNDHFPQYCIYKANILTSLHLIDMRFREYTIFDGRKWKSEICASSQPVYPG